jgi:uncharacterized protein (UPF0210 family)
MATRTLNIVPLLLWLWLCAVAAPAQTKPAVSAERPKIRALTAFVRLDRNRYVIQLRETLSSLHRAKSVFEGAGYEVQSLRISTQPFPEYIKDMPRENALSFFREYDAIAAKEGFDASIGPAMLKDDDDPAMTQLLGEVLVGTTILEGSVVVAGEDGVHWNSARAAARLMKYVAGRSPRSQGNFRFAATALVPPLTPFYPGSYHAGPGRQFAVGLQSANVVAAAFASRHVPQQAREELEARLGEHARAIEAAAQRVERETGWEYVGLDLSPAPLKDVSIGDAIEKFTGTKFGSPGTMTAVAVITEALRAISVKHAGYSGVMLPIMEDNLLAQRWGEGSVRLDALLAYSAVCGTGLDVVPLAGNTTQAQIEHVIEDMASIAVRWHKPLSARLLPVAGKKPGDRTEFDDPFLVNTTIQPLSQ